MVASISQDKWDLLGLPLGTPQADTVINKSLEQLNDRRGQAAELNIGRNQIQRLDNVSESLKRMQREQVAGFTKVADAVADANILSIGELMNIRDSVKDLTKTLKTNAAFQPGNRRSAAQRAMDGLDLDGPDRKQRRGRTTMQRTNRGNVQVRPPSVPKQTRQRPFPNLRNNSVGGNYGGGSVPNFPLQNSPQAPNGGGGFMDAMKYLGSALLTRLPAIVAVSGVAAGVSHIGSVNAKNLEGVAPGEVHNYQKNKMKAANQAARDRILATREAVELNKPGNLDAAGNPTAEALNNITEKTREAAKEQLEELDGDIADIKRKSEKGFLSKLGGWLGLTSSSDSGGSGSLPSGGGAAAGAAIGAAIGRAASGGVGGAPADRVLGRFSGYTSQGSNVASGAVAGTNSSVGDVGGMARAGSRVTGNIVDGNNGKVLDRTQLEGSIAGGNETNVKNAMLDRALRSGITKEQAAGMVGNFQGESLDPTNNTGDGGRAFGIGQWHPDRQAKLKAYAEITGKDFRQRGTQIDFATHEMGITKDGASLNMTEAQKRASGFGTEGLAGKRLLETNTPGAAAEAMVRYYERPKDKDGQSRLRAGYADNVMSNYNRLQDAPVNNIYKPDGTPVAAGKSNVVMANQGKIRDMDIKPELKNQLEYAAAQNGVKVEVTSGGQAEIGTSRKRTGSTRHDLGGAADLQLYRTDENGKRTYLDMNNPADAAIMQKFTTDSVKAGATGVGAGYMGGKTLHIGGGSDASWGGAPWVEEARKAGVAGRAGFDMNKWLETRKAEAAASAVSQTQKTYAEKMQDAGFTQKTPFGVRPPGNKSTDPMAGTGFRVNNNLGESDKGNLAKNSLFYNNTGLANQNLDQKLTPGPTLGPSAFGTESVLLPKTESARDKFSAGDRYFSKSYDERMGTGAAGAINRMVSSDKYAPGNANNDLTLPTSESIRRQMASDVTPGTVTTPPAYTAPEPASTPAAGSNGSGGGGGGSTPQVSPSEIKTQPDDLGLNGMNTTDVF